MKKIGIMGSHGTGKTTLAFKLAAEHKAADPGKNVTIVSEVARRCPLPINKETTLEAQVWIFCHQLASEIEAEAKNDIVICDRTLLDNLAYFKRLFVLGYEGDDDERLFHRLFKIAIDWLSTYDKLYFLRPKAKITRDGVRSADKGFQMEIDDTLSKWIDKNCIEVKTL